MRDPRLGVMSPVNHMKQQVEAALFPVRKYEVMRPLRPLNVFKGPIELNFRG